MSHFPAWCLFFIQIPKRYVRTDVRYDRYTERIMLTCIKKNVTFIRGMFILVFVFCLCLLVLYHSIA